MRPIDLLKLTETNEFLTDIILDQVTMLLNTYEKFNGFNNNNGFVNLFNQNCVLTGSTMIEFLLGEKYPDSNIDIFINTRRELNSMLSYLYFEGYTDNRNNSESNSDNESNESDESSNSDNESDLFAIDNITAEDSGYSDIDNRFENRFGFREIENLDETNSDTPSAFREEVIEHNLTRSIASSSNYDSYSDISSDNETLINSDSESNSESSSDSTSDSTSDSESDTDDTFEIYTLYRSNFPNIRIVFKEITMDDYINTIDLQICKNFFYTGIAYSHDLFDKKSEINIDGVKESSTRIKKYIGRGFEFKLTP